MTKPAMPAWPDGGTPMTFAAQYQLSSAFEQFRTSREVSA
jgi:hypothetical protein